MKEERKRENEERRERKCENGWMKTKVRKKEIGKNIWGRERREKKNEEERKRKGYGMRSVKERDVKKERNNGKETKRKKEIMKAIKKQ